MKLGRNTYSKYHAKKTEVDGIMFASKKEAQRYCQLRLLERAGEISDLQIQVPYILFEKNEYGRQIKYIADFVYLDNDRVIVEDCKGMRTDVYKLKKRMLAERYGIIIRES